MAGLRARLSAITCSAVCAALLSLPAPAQAQEPEQLQTVTYQAYASGINAVTARLNVALEPQDRYNLSLSAWTRGLLGAIVPWEGHYETYGWLRGNEGHPEMHKSHVFGNEDELKEYSYNRDGTFGGLRVIEDGRDISPETLEPELVDGTTDALSATLAVMKHVTEHGVCEGSSEVFDGKRRFELAFTHEGYEILEPTRRNVYAGEAARCTVEVRPIAGQWSERPRGWMSIQEQGRNQGALPTVWLATVREGAPAVPVKVQVRTDYGTLFMHMADYDISGTSRRAEAQ